MKRIFTVISCLIFLSSILLGLTSFGIQDYASVKILTEYQSVQIDEIEQIKEGRHISIHDLVKFSCAGHELPKIQETGKYLFPNRLDSIELNVQKDVSISWSQSQISKEIKLIAFNDTSYRTYSIVTSDFPIVHLAIGTTSSNPIKDEDTAAYLTIFDSTDTNTPVQVIHSLAQTRTRGLTSLNYPKKGYTVEILSGVMNKSDTVSIPGFAPNFKFALNSLYEDDSKIRDLLSLEIWHDMLTKRQNASNEKPIDMKLVELIIDKQYWGLYGMHEIVNQYTLGIPKNEKATVYKINSWLSPERDNLNPRQLFWETAYENPKLPTKETWEPLHKFFNLVYYADDEEFVDKISNYIDMENSVDLFILIELTFAKDNLWKNMVFTYRPDYFNSLLVVTPWDFDMTFGALYKKGYEYNVKLDSQVASQELLFVRDDLGEPTNSFLTRLWETDVHNFRFKVSQRWFELRSDIFLTNNLIERADKLYNSVSTSGARERDSKRWPECAQSIDNNFIKNYIEQRTIFLDNYFSEYSHVPE